MKSIIDWILNILLISLGITYITFLVIDLLRAMSVACVLLIVALIKHFIKMGEYDE